MKQGEGNKFWGFTFEGEPRWVILREAHIVTLCPELYDDADFRRVEFVVSCSMADKEAWVITELETGTKLPWAYCETQLEAIEAAQVYIRNRGTWAIRKAIQKAKLLPGWFPLGEPPQKAEVEQEENPQPCILPGDLLPEECCKSTELSNEGFSPDTKEEYIPTYQELCTEIRIFNVRYPVGSLVMVEKDDGSKVTTRVRYPAKIVGDSPVVWLEDILGCYKMDRVEGVPAPDKVDRFNKRYPVGSEVKATRDNGAVENVKVMEPARWFGGRAVVWIRKIGGSYAGYKSLDSFVVQPATAEAEPPDPPYLSPYEKVHLFNKKYPVGTEVNVTRDDGSVARTKVRAPAHLLAGKAEVWLEDILVFYDLDRVNMESVGENPKTLLAALVVICDQTHRCDSGAIDCPHRKPHDFSRLFGCGWAPCERLDPLRRCACVKLSGREDG